MPPIGSAVISGSHWLAVFSVVTPCLAWRWLSAISTPCAPSFLRTAASCSAVQSLPAARFLLRAAVAFARAFSRLTN